MEHILIVYYSRKGENYWGGEIRDLEKGNTEIVAEMIQEAVGGGMGHSERDLKRICTGADVRPGLAIRGCQAADSEDKVTTWLRSLDLGM